MFRFITTLLNEVSPNLDFPPLSCQSGAFLFFYKYTTYLFSVIFRQIVEKLWFYTSNNVVVIHVNHRFCGPACFFKDFRNFFQDIHKILLNYSNSREKIMKFGAPHLVLNIYKD